MGKFESYFIYLYLQTFSNFYCQFIDDIFLIWNGNDTQLLDFITRLNSIQPTIKFDLKYSKSSIEFLDTKKLQKQREEQITNNNKSETNRSEELFGSYFSTPEIVD